MKRSGVGRTEPPVEAVLHRGKFGIIIHDVLQW